MKFEIQREAALFQAAVELDGGARASFLENACGNDISLRHRLEALLAAHEQSQGVLTEPSDAARETMEIKFADAPDEIPGQKIGRYKILEKIGEGGCGVVYVAEQTEPVRRRVALKVIKLGMDTKTVVARFEAERQALALMDHPNIARVLDAGTTETGRPYFIMELVRGIKLTDYCDQNKLPTRERLDLFIKICHAIQHAHQKGIIHRDIKPSNILVTLHDGVPVPKVIDFGIAKATEGKLTDATIYTQLHQFIGTPAYMSPEQAEMSGLDIDTRSDIYSLGVLLYELLTGKTPFDAKELMSLGIDAMRKTIREKEPVRPSTRLAKLQDEELSRTATRHAAEAPKLVSQLRGDLDWVVMRCLEKDRTRRYETANGLALDIKRHLANEPVAARPPSAAYKFQKAFRRNKVAFTAGFAVAAALLLGLIATTLQSVRATRAKKEALEAQAREVGQRNKAEANERKAVAAQKAEAAEELAARQRAYASDMNAAMQAFHKDNLGRVLDLLNRQKPRPSQRDLRGWEWRYLWMQTRGDALFTLCQQSSEIYSLAASSDGNFLALGDCHKGGITIWAARTRQELAHLARSDAYVRCAFSPTGPLLAFTSFDTAKKKSTLHLWNAEARQMIVEIPLDGRCLGLAFSQDSKTLVTSSKNITLWRAFDGAKLSSYSFRAQIALPATGIAATPDLSLAAYVSGSVPQKVRVVDLRNGKERWAAVPSSEWITALAFSPDGKTLATADGFSKSDISLWDVATGEQIGKLEGHTSWCGALVFWPDGKKLASAGADRTIRIWDLASRKCLDVLRGHRGEVWRLALLPDNKTLVSGCKDGTVCFWDTSVTHSRQESITLPERIRCWKFAPDNQSVLTLSPNGEVARWTGPSFEKKEPQFEVGRSISSYGFSQDGRFLAVGLTGGIPSVWDVPRRVLRCELTNTTSDNVVVFLDNGNKLITASLAPPLFHEWDLATGSEIQSWPSPAEYGVGVSPNEQLFATVDPEGGVVARNLTDKKDITLPVDVSEGYGIAFSPAGEHLAIASALGFARIWDTKAWHELTTLRGFMLGVHSVAFSHDGKRLATGSSGSVALKLWDTESWQEVLTLRGAGSEFFETAFSADGSSLGTMDDSGVLMLWRAPSWAEIDAAENARADK
ncbi:MAG TPA: serine/threonine-protein kinase [Verrucomicrobiae bacterium]|nr:serine/threonine-protein kinase [Verrucomicrobiae bacterium]